MTTTTINLHVSPAASAGRFAARLGQLFAAAFALMTHTRQPKALHDPSRETAKIRALASSYEQADPRFAADLYAAADRHEMLNGG